MLEFFYTKADGSVSERVALVLTKPSDNYLMLDLTDLDADEIDYLEQRVAQYKSEQKELLDKYKFGPYMKTFKESGICTK